MYSIISKYIYVDKNDNFLYYIHTQNCRTFVVPLYFSHNMDISRQKKIPRAVGALGICVVETTELESVTSCV